MQSFKLYGFDSISVEMKPEIQFMSHKGPEVVGCDSGMEAQ